MKESSRYHSPNHQRKNPWLEGLGGKHYKVVRDSGNVFFVNNPENPITSGQSALLKALSDAKLVVNESDFQGTKAYPIPEGTIPLGSLNRQAKEAWADQTEDIMRQAQELTGIPEAVLAPYIVHINYVKGDERSVYFAPSVVDALDSGQNLGSIALGSD